MKGSRNIIMLVLITLISSCQFDPYADDFTTKQPAKNDVLGIYQFKEQTISGAPIDKLGQKGTIVLKSDGTYQANNIPNVFGGTQAESHKLISAKGSWTIETVGAVDNGWGHEKSHWGITLTSIDENLTTVGFMGDGPPYQLIVTFDDPDLGHVMIFSKSELSE